MKNSVTERIPYEWFEIDAIEGWLDEHVQQGLRLVNITPLKRAEFETAVGSITRYRIHLKEKKNDSHDEEYRATFRELGWEFVAELNDQADVYQAIRPDAVEINTDEEILRSVIDKVVKRQRISLLIYLLFLPYWCYLQIDNFNFSAYLGPYDFLLSNAVFVILDALLLSVWIVLFATAFTRLRNVKNRYFLQRDYHTPTVAKRRKRPHIYTIAVCSAILVVLLVTAVFFNGNDDERIENNPCPVTDLSVINPEEYANLQPHDIWAHSGSYLLYDYTTYRRDAEPLEMPGNWAYTPYHYVVYLQEITIKSGVEPYFQECLSDTKGPWQKVDISGWDEAWYQSCETTHAESLAWVGREFEGIEDLPPFRAQQLYLRDGNTVIHIDYTGKTDLYPQLQELYGK